MDKVPMTVEGEEHLKTELDRLKRIERPKITIAIAEARAHGDLKENAEYHAAREQQGINEARIRDMEHKLSHSQVIDITSISNEGKVIFGATVTVVNLGSDAETTYQIVGEDEADYKQQKISITSPIARALIGKKQGDEVEVQTPAGLVEYEICQVQYL